jgi:two-component system, cell cycle response regulator
MENIPHEIAPEIYWVGANSETEELQCNTYLLLDNEEAILFDPGSVLDYESVKRNIQKIIPLNKITHIVVHHQDDDFSSSLSLFEKDIPNALLVIHEKAYLLIKYYVISLKTYFVNEHEYLLTLSSGKEIHFFHTPYLYFSGSIISYDADKRVLFSSDLFGAFTVNRSLYADSSYIDAMISFHETFMSSNESMRPVMETIKLLDINIIAPQHGSIINENLEHYIDALLELEGEAFLKPIKKYLVDSGVYLNLCNLLLKRLYSIFSIKEVQDVFHNTPVFFDENQEISETLDVNIEIWNFFFEKIYAKKGFDWLMIVEAYVKKLAKEYDISLPNIYSQYTFNIQQKLKRLNKENLTLKISQSKIQETLIKAQNNLIKESVTEFFNEEVFYKFLNEQAVCSLDKKDTSVVALFEIDRFSYISINYGQEESRALIKALSILIRTSFTKESQFFKLSGPIFAVYIPNISLNDALNIIEEFRKNVQNNTMLTHGITLSIGVADMTDCYSEGVAEPNKEFVCHRLKSRLNDALQSGGNAIFLESSKDEIVREDIIIAVVDNDEYNTGVLKHVLEKLNFQTVIYNDGAEALEGIPILKPDFIVSETILLKVDGFTLRSEIFKKNDLKDIPFIFVSQQKNDEDLQRAHSLGVFHFFKKPYLLSEVVGIIKYSISK